jgi:hypothetical protein
MFDHVTFTAIPKVMLIAPAGFGKTHTIAECIRHLAGKGKQLILTHTHAGIATIKDKLKIANISPSSYEVTTISSFAQKYVLAFYTGLDVPGQDDSKRYYPFLIEKMIELVKLSPLKTIIQSTYSGLFVDEYQDCTIKQHGLIVLLSGLFPTRILGDFLQGIFDFNGERLVDMKNDNEMVEFSPSTHELQTPHRWINQNNPSLGADLKKIRAELILKREINLPEYPSIELHLVAEQDLFNPQSIYSSKIRKLLKEKEILVIHPDSTSINPRLSVIKLFNNSLSLVESIDDKEFYQLSREADSLTGLAFEKVLISMSRRLFNKTGHDVWFNDKGFKKKTKREDKDLPQPIELKTIQIKKNISFILLADILRDIKNLKEIKCYRSELFSTFCRALEDAEIQNISVFDAMLNKRNLIRRIGRKIYGRCIGTTLLTKGLEFETVVIINAHKFSCPKHLYVALTRASKRLVIFSNNKILKPYKL